MSFNLVNRSSRIVHCCGGLRRVVGYAIRA